MQNRQSSAIQVLLHPWGTYSNSFVPTEWISPSLQWRHNGRDGVSNHQPYDCLFNRLHRRRSKKTSKFRVTGLCAGKWPVTGEFPAQMASNAENVSIWWRHHGSEHSRWRCQPYKTYLEACYPHITIVQLRTHHDLRRGYTGRQRSMMRERRPCNQGAPLNKMYPLFRWLSYHILVPI